MSSIELTDKAEQDIESIKSKSKNELSEDEIVELALDKLNKRVTRKQYEGWFKQ